MFGVFIIPAKTDNKAFKFNADGKKALKLDEAEFVQLVRTTPKMTYFVHHQDTYDSLPDDEKIQQTKKNAGCIKASNGICLLGTIIPRKCFRRDRNSRRYFFTRLHS